MPDILHIGSHRERFWDNSLIDTRQTTSSFLLHHPERQPPCFLRDKPWEGGSTTASSSTGRRTAFWHCPPNPELQKGAFPVFRSPDFGKILLLLEICLF